MIKKTIIFAIEILFSVLIMFIQQKGKPAYNGAFIMLGIIIIAIFTTIYVKQVIKNKKEKVIFENEYKKAKEEKKDSE